MVARDWMVQNIPAGTKIVVEPIAPDQWAMDAGPPALRGPGRDRQRQPLEQVAHVALVLLQRQDDHRRGACPVVKLEDYERTTRPELVESYARRRLLLGRHRLDAVRPRVRGPEGRAGRARRYYDELKRQRRSRLPRRARTARTPRRVPFSFDYSFNYYPLTYERPGPEIVIYRLDGGKCACMKRLVARRRRLRSAGRRRPEPDRLARRPRARDEGHREGPARPGRAGARRAGDAQRRAEHRCSSDRDHRRRRALRGRPGRQAAALRRPQPRRLRRGRHDAPDPARAAASRPRTSSPTTRASTRGTPRSGRSASSTSQSRSSSPSASTWPARSTTPAAPA